MKNGNNCAFHADSKTQTDGGLTKREYFAAMAMQGLIVSQGEKNIVNDWGVNGQRISENAVHIADELLKELEK